LVILENMNIKIQAVGARALIGFFTLALVACGGNSSSDDASDAPIDDPITVDAANDTEDNNDSGTNAATDTPEQTVTDADNTPSNDADVGIAEDPNTTPAIVVIPDSSPETDQPENNQPAIDVSETTMGSPAVDNDVVVNGNRILWPAGGEFLVQDATTFDTVCEGGASCLSGPGTFTVIDTVNMVRFENIVVGDGIATNSFGLAPRLVTAQKLPVNCIGSRDNDGSLFCVHPDTREFSATDAAGSPLWTFTLPGDNSSNEIESVHTTDDFVVLVADLFPLATSLTFPQRISQYEISLFEKNGAFISTLPLQIDIGRGGNEQDVFPVVITAGAQSTAEPLLARTVQPSGGRPYLLLAYRGFAINNQWGTGGLNKFDLQTGELLSTLQFVNDIVRDISYDEADPDVLRITSNENILWVTLDDLTITTDRRLARRLPSTLVQPGNTDDHLNSANYEQVIQNLLPWINAEIPRELLFSSEDPVTSGGTRYNFPFEITQLTTQESRGDSQTVFNYLCPSEGKIARLRINSVAISTNLFDACRLGNNVVDGRLDENSVGRDGAGWVLKDFKVHNDDGTVSNASMRYRIDLSRVATGLTASFNSGVISRNGINQEIVTNYSSSAQFLYGDNIFPGSTSCGTTAVTREDGTEVFVSLFCDRETTLGSIEAAFDINADWSGFTTLEVETSLDFGQEFFRNIGWNTADPELLDLLGAPPVESTDPPTEFYFDSGNIRITAEDNSAILLEPFGTPVDHPMMQATLISSDGISQPALAVFVDIDCEVRLGLECIQPQ